MTPPINNLQLKTGKDLNYNAELAKDAADLFARRRAGHTAKWQYSDPLFEGDPTRGALYWDDFATNYPEYYIPRDELEILTRCAPEIVDIIKDTQQLIDLGPGSINAIRAKTIPFTSQLDLLHRYTAIDFADSFLFEAKNAINKSRQNPVSVNILKRDFTKFAAPSIEHTTVLYSGGSIANMTGDIGSPTPTDQVKSILELHRPHMGGYMVIAVDSNQNGDEVVDSYLPEAHKLMDQNFMYRVARDVMPQGDFDPSAWAYIPVWNGQTSQLAHTLVSTRSQTFSIGDETFKIQHGEQFCVDNSWKYRKELFQEIAVDSGYEPVKSFTNEHERVHVHVLRALTP